MLKKILCIMLCVALVLPSCIVHYVPVSAAPTPNIVLDGYAVNEEFDDATTLNFTQTLATVSGAVEVGDGYVQVSAKNNTGATLLHAPDVSNFTVKKYEVEIAVKKIADAYQENEGDYVFAFGAKRACNASNSNLDAYGIVLPFGGFPVGTVRTYKFTVDETTAGLFSDVTVKDGDGSPVTLVNSSSWAEGKWQREDATFYSGNYANGDDPWYGFNIRTISALAANVGIGNHSSLVYQVDYVKIKRTDATCVSSVTFEGAPADGSEPSNGTTVTPKISLFNGGGLENATVMTAVYNTNGEMTELYRSTYSSLGTGDIILSGNPVTWSDNFGRVEAFLWGSEDGTMPIGRGGVLGTADAVTASETSATLGTSGTGKTGSFANLGRTTKANEITVVGKHDSGEAALVTLVAKGDTSGTVVYATQFETTADGSFTKKIVIDPAKIAADEDITVTLAGFDTNTRSFAIPAKSGWSAIVTDFNNIDGTDSSAETFLTTYGQSYFEYFATDATDAASEFIDFGTAALDEKYAQIGFLAKYGEYGDVEKVGDVIDALIAIITEDVAKVDDFVAEFTNAKTVTQTIAAVSAAIEGVNERFGYDLFDLSGLANIDAVYRELLNKPDADVDAIAEIYNAFYELKGAQQSAEATIVEPFRDEINSATALKEFIDGEYAQLGVSVPAFDGLDYHIMFSAYDEKGFDDTSYTTPPTSTDSAAVITDVEFLMNYLTAYKSWAYAVDTASASGAEAEWNAIKNIFALDDNITSPLSIALADATVKYLDDNTVSGSAGSDKTTDRLADLFANGTITAATLAAAETKDADIVNVVKAIDSVHSAANDPFGQPSETGYYGRVQTAIQNAHNNGYITFTTAPSSVSDAEATYGAMLAKPYRYVSDIKTDYEAAANPAPGSGSDSGSSGGGGGSTVNGSDGKVTAGNDASKDDDTEGHIINNSNESQVVLDKEGHPVEPFTDITADYAWAKEPISMLREFNIVKGDGNGKFRPGDSISREEFLSILLNVFEIEITETDANFSDVKKGEWYAGVVATACKKGIVNGYPDGRFGIGDEVLRADMAVMIVRALQVMGVDIATEEKGFVFKDYTDIPDYAYNAVVKLQQAGLVQGDDYGMYNPLEKLTRAESAVALHSIFKQLSGMHFYSWNDELYSGSYVN